MGKTILKSILILIVVAVMVSFVREAQLNNQKLELKSIEVKDTSAELKVLNQKYDEELNNKTVNEQKLQELQKQLEEKDKQLQAKKAQKATLAIKSSPVASASPVGAVSGDWVAQCHAWASQAGITLDNSAIKLLERESHCNPVSRNPTSSAGGIPQALPWTKMGCPLSVEGAPCQLKWFQGYVLGRYGSYSAALGHSYRAGWY